MEASEKIYIDSNPELAKFIGVDSENNPEISNKIPENKKKKFIINDLPSFTTLLAGGATLFEGAKDAVVIGLAGIAASITQSICSTFEKTGTEKAVEKAKSEIFKKLAEIADTELFKKVETVTTNGIQINIGSIGFNVFAESDKWNVEPLLNGEKVNLKQLQDVVDTNLIISISETSPRIYGDLLEDIKAGASPSNLLEIIDCIKKYPNDFNYIYDITEDINITYEFVNATGNATTQLLSYANEQINSLSKTQRRKFNTACVVIEPSLSEKIFFGRNKGIELSNADKHPLLFGENGILPSKSLNEYVVGNCAEVDGVNQALNAGGKIENMYMLTIHTTNEALGEAKIACENCTYAFKGKIKLNISGWIK